MAHAYKCDRCGKLFTLSRYGDERSGSIEGDILFDIGRTSCYPDRLDLCSECFMPIKELIDQWWLAGLKKKLL